MSELSDTSSAVTGNSAKREKPLLLGNREQALDEAYRVIRQLRQEVARANKENGVLQNYYNHLLREKKKDEDLIKTLTGGWAQYDLALELIEEEKKKLREAEKAKIE